MWNLNLSDSLAATGIIVAIVVALVTWLITWIVLRAQTGRKELSYTIKMTKIISRDTLKGEKKLEITYDGEYIHDLMLLEINAKNTGNLAVENANVVIENCDATYMIPGYIEDIPKRYEKLWVIERTDAEQCVIHFDHINPGQIAKVRLIMDTVPKEEPTFVCPMPGLKIRRVVADVFTPFIHQTLLAILKHYI